MLLTWSCLSEWISVPSSSSSPSTLSSPPPRPSPSHSIDAVIELRPGDDAPAPSHPDMAIHTHHTPPERHREHSVLVPSVQKFTRKGVCSSMSTPLVTESATALEHRRSRQHFICIHIRCVPRRGHTQVVWPHRLTLAQKDTAPMSLRPSFAHDASKMFQQSLSHCCTLALDFNCTSQPAAHTLTSLKTVSFLSLGLDQGQEAGQSVGRCLPCGSPHGPSHLAVAGARRDAKVKHANYRIVHSDVCVLTKGCRVHVGAHVQHRLTPARPSQCDS